MKYNIVTDHESSKVLYRRISTSYLAKNKFQQKLHRNKSSSVPSPLYQTTRIFHSESWYRFTTVPNNTYMVRFHFLSFSSPINLSTAKFNISVPGFLLLTNFDAKNTTNSPLVKEYYVKIIRKRYGLSLTG